ncbi:DUF4271 domain-containing protein [Pedobacter endophyticus]|uniref:DUF4271 domain-containing protein n=1 Tax=Pedobacter endophyticus TaxID=2789740 RepID=A0A7S9L3C3_9SPHI|nr:DUF4271 domain-containing protein [Pedobacter endophyticus]QPH41700.1 DUF4271 domain-containing protein [Pedobacter endophyticus]
MPKYVFLLLALLLSANLLSGQETPADIDSAAVVKYQYTRYRVDSATWARQIFVTDSVMRHTWVLSDSLINKAALLDSLQKEYIFPKLDLIEWQKKYQHLKKKANPYQLGTRIRKGNVGLLGFIFLMLIIFAILKNAFSKQLSAIVQSFFSNRVLNNINKEDNLFSSWPFLLLFVQFGFVFGMFFFLVAQWKDMYQAKDGFKFFFSISLIIIVFYALKLIVLRFLGYLFNVQKPVGEYISILYLSYFNASLLFIPLVVSFALSPLKYGEVYIVLAFLLLAVIFTFQLLRAGVTILSNNKFSRMHLILYFCALEICPILILIKTIGL